MADTPRISPGGAIVMGLFCGAMGTLIVLVALGVVGELKPGDAPAWVVFCAGLVFILGGLAVIVGYGIATGVTADGDFAPDTAMSVRVVQSVLGLGIAVMLSVIVTWIAVDPGPRELTATSTFGGVAVRGVVSETSGRVAWGVGAAFMWAVTAALAIVCGKRVRRARRP